MKSRFRLACIPWLVGLAVVILLLAGCDVAQPRSSQSSTPSSTNASSAPIIIHGEVDRPVYDTPELMCQAPLVVDTSISSLGQSHWNTPDGTRPLTLDANAVIKQGYIIYTPIRFSSMRIHVDSRKQPTSEFATVGGQVGQDQYWTDFPQVVPTRQYVLVFQIASDRQGQSPTGKMLAVVDAFPISAKGIVTLAPGSIEQGVVTPPTTMPLSELVQQLANCK